MLRVLHIPSNSQYWARILKLCLDEDKDLKLCNSIFVELIQIKYAQNINKKTTELTVVISGYPFREIITKQNHA